MHHNINMTIGVFCVDKTYSYFLKFGHIYSMDVQM